STPGPIHGKETQTRWWDYIEMAISMCHQLIGLLCSGVETDGIVDTVSFGKRNFCVLSIYRGTGCIHEMLNLVVTATLQDIDNANQVAIRISHGVFQTIPHTCLGS